VGRAERKGTSSLQRGGWIQSYPKTVELSRIPRHWNSNRRFHYHFSESERRRIQANGRTTTTLFPTANIKLFVGPINDISEGSNFTVDVLAHGVVDDSIHFQIVIYISLIN
jgi:hypothetical protein